MKTHFRIVGLPLARFAPLFSLDHDDLARRGARRLVVEAKPGSPCRVGLREAEIGEQVILLPFWHHDVQSPYRASGPIFVSESATEADLAPGEVPEIVRSRVMSVRAYDREGSMRNAIVTPGTDLESAIDQFFADPQVRYLHLHNAGAGCYSSRVDRA